jgi:hypothetical protein
MSIEVNKTDRIVNVTVEKKYGKSIEADIDIAGQRVGFKQEGEANFTYIDLPKLTFDELTEAQQDSLKLTFDQLTQAEKDSLKGSDANVTQENIENALPYVIAKDNEVVKITGKRPQNYTETDHTNYRPVANSQLLKASPASPVAQTTDYHGTDFKHSLEGANINDKTNLYPFEIQGYTAGSVGAASIGSIVDFYTLIEHYATGILKKAIGYQIWNRNRSSGTITDSKGILIKNPLNDGGGQITDSYGIYIEEHTGATSKNYDIWANGKSFFKNIVVDNIEWSSVIYGDNQRGTKYSSNLNTILKSGFYAANTSTTNAPSSSFWGIQHNQINSLDVYATQIAINYTNGTIYSRYNNNNNWSAWKQLDKGGATGSFTSQDGKTVTVTDGLITSIA